MSRRRWWGWKFLAWLIAGLLFLLLVVMPLAMTYLAKTFQTVPESVADYLLFTENIMFYLMLAFAAAWVFFLGGTFASFLNVVAARVPQGKSILGSSHCPYCNVRLSFRDNIPYWGWLKNFGRCSKCRLPITPRYLYVEVALGVLFLGLTSLTLLTGGITLPIREVTQISMLGRRILDPPADLVQILAIQLLMLLGLFTLVLVELDRQKIPMAIWATSIVFGLAFAALCPGSILISWLYPMVDVELPMSRELAVVTSLIGICFGFFIGWMLDKLLDETQEKAGSETSGLRIAYGLSMLGLFAGWQSVIVVAMLYIFARAIFPRFAGSDSKSYVSNMFWSPNAALLFAVLLHLASWRWIGSLV